MTAILDGGRSFPFAGVSTDLVEQRGNASDYNNKLEQLAICNHKHLPLSGGKGSPCDGGPTACLLCSAHLPSALAGGFLLYTLVSILVNFYRKTSACPDGAGIIPPGYTLPSHAPGPGT